jgi:hypothetical protein
MSVKDSSRQPPEGEAAIPQEDLLLNVPGGPASSGVKPQAGHDAELHRLSELSKKLAKGKDLPPGERQALVEKCLTSARSLNFPKLIASLEAELETLQKATAGELQHKRQQVLQSLHKAGLVVRSFTDYDRAGPLRIIHKGRTTNILFGKLRLDSFDESNGERAAERIVAQVRRIMDAPFDSAGFYRDFRRAYEHARLEVSSRDGWLPVDLIHQEYSLGKLRATMGKKATPITKDAESYSLVMFLIDFARFQKNPVRLTESEYIRSRTPAMSQTKDAYLVPDLSVPLGEERLMLDLRIEREP